MSERNLKDLLILLLQEHHLLTVAQILEKLKKQGKSFNKTSVYRSIEQLQADSMICQHFFDKNQATYELREHHHAHLVCEKCGKIEIAECLYDQPKTVQNFHITHHHLTLIGVCGGCERR